VRIVRGILIALGLLALGFALYLAVPSKSHGAVDVPGYSQQG
jgi:hypothetical protein